MTYSDIRRDARHIATAITMGNFDKATAIAMDNFDKTYVHPTKWDYVKHLVTSYPTWEEANMWSNFRLDGGPMTEKEYQGFLDIFSEDPKYGKENADSINRKRCRTTFGWYIGGWFFYFKRMVFFDYEEFCANTQAIAFNRMMDEMELEYSEEDWEDIDDGLYYNMENTTF